MDRAGHEFVHNSMPKTRTPCNQANTFSTWFTLHAIVDIGSVLYEDSFYKNRKSEFDFNKSCSMGWGRSNIRESYESTEALLDNVKFVLNRFVVTAYDLKQRLKK